MHKKLSLIGLSLLSALQLHAIDNLMTTLKYGPTDLAGTLSFNKHTFGIDFTVDTADNLKPKFDLGYLLVDEGSGGVDYTLQFAADLLYESSEIYYGRLLPYAYGGIGYEYVHHERAGFESAPYLQIAGGVEMPMFGSENDDFKLIAEARWMQMVGSGGGQESEATIFVGVRIATGAIGFQREEAYIPEEQQRYAELEADEKPRYAPELTQEHVVFSDADGDGVPDKDDQCPHTIEGAVVDQFGCADGQRGAVWHKPQHTPVQQVRTPKRTHPVFRPLPRQRKVMTALFESDSTTISKSGREKLRHLVEQLNREGYRYITVEGYTDNSGTFAQNMALSKKRARKVRDLMVQYGIDPEKITAVGKGALNPIADNDVPEGRALNRRIELVFE